MTYANQIPRDAFPAAPKSTTDGAQDSYEAGTVTGVRSAGRYKSYSRAYSSRPTVIVSGFQRSGSTNVMLQGTPNVGSFSVKTDRAGSVSASYFAIGPR